MPSRDQQRYRLTYSYYRVQPRMEVQYIVDDSLDWKNSVRVASTASVSLTGSAPLSIDSISLASGNRVLLKNQGTGSQNGIYVYSLDESGSNYTLTRSYDASAGTLSCGASTYVEDGSTNAGRIYILSTLEPITVDSTSLTWTQFAGGGGSPGGSDTYVQFNDGGSFGGSSGLRYNKTTGAVTGTYVLASTGFSGSLTRLTDGTSYLIAGSGISIATGSNGAVTITNNGTVGDITSVTAGTGLTGGGSSGAVTLSINDSVVATVSGTTFTGVTKHSAGLSGSLTRLADGTSYLIAGSNVTITTGSSGAVTIDASSSGLGGSGTTNFIPKFATSTTLGDSILEEGLGVNYIGSSTAFLTSSGYGITFTQPQIWSLPDNAFALNIDGKFKFDTNGGGSLGIGTPAAPAQKLHIVISEPSTDTPFASDAPRVIRLQNTSTTANNSTSIVNADGSGGDVNSYIRFINVDHSSDKGALTFGTRNGASSGERMRIDESGNIGIGSIAPTSIGTDVFLFVSGSSGSLGTSDRGVSAFGGDVIISGSLKVGTGSVLVTSNDIQFGTSGMRIQKSGNDMKFFDLNNTGGKTLTEIVAGGSASPEYWASPTNGVIYATGSVGIGTTSPTEKFSVHTTGQDRVGFGVSSAVSTVYLGSTTSTEAYRTIEFDRSAGKLHFKYGNVGSALSTVATFDASGRAGIGNTSPTTKLFVESSSGVQIEATDGTVSQRVGYCLTNIAYSGTSTGHPYAFLTTDVERMRIDTSGNVGIGTSSISARLHVSGSGTGTTTTLIAKHGVANGSSLPVLNVQNSAGDSLLYVSGSGFVGIGTSTASSVTNLLKSLGGNVLSIAGPSASSLLFEVNGNLSGSISTSNSGMTVVPGANRTLGLGSDNGVKLTIDTEGDVNLQASDRYFDASIASGQGIKLRSTPGNSDAQVLDAYYEADLSPGIDCTGNEGNGVYVLDAAYDTLKMTRVGRLVTIGGDLRIDSLGDTPSGRLFINLGTSAGQYPSMDTAASVYVTGAIDLSGAVATSIQAYVASGGGRMYVDGYLNGSKVDIATQVGAGVTIKISVTYSV